MRLPLEHKRRASAGAVSSAQGTVGNGPSRGAQAAACVAGLARCGAPSDRELYGTQGGASGRGANTSRAMPYPHPLVGRLRRGSLHAPANRIVATH